MRVITELSSPLNGVASSYARGFIFSFKTVCPVYGLTLQMDKLFRRPNDTIALGRA